MSEHLTNNPPLRVPGTAVVLDRMAKGVALALSHNIRCSHILYENVLLVAVTTTEPPRVSDEDAVVVTPIAEGITRVEVKAIWLKRYVRRLVLKELGVAQTEASLILLRELSPNSKGLQRSPFGVPVES